MLFRDDYKSDKISINSILFFCPLELPSLSRTELERFLKNVFDSKLGETIISIFFTKKNEYRTAKEYLVDVKRKM